MTVLAVSNARKRYGSVHALAGASLGSASRRTAGAARAEWRGQDDLIRAIAGRARLDAGEIRVFDRVVQAGTTAPELGIVPQELALYPMMSARENLAAFGRLHGLPAGELTARMEWALERTGLACRWPGICRGSSS